ncbi:hypothetical protein JCM10207_001671 [Rhodosporidiobolus poonsookiae]
MTTLADTQQQLLELLNSLSADENPYLAIRVALKASLFPTIPRSALIQLYVLIGFLGLTAALVAISLLIRWRKGVFWLFRMQQAPRMIRPHAATSWATVAFVMLIFFELLIWREIQFLQHTVDPNFMYWILLLWGLPWAGGHCAAWSLAVSLLLHLHATHPHFPAYRVAPYVNAFGVGSPFIYAAILLPTGILGGMHFSNAIHYYLSIDDLLDNAAKSWTPGTQFSIITLAPALSSLSGIEAEVAGFIKYFRVVFSFYAVTAALLVVCLVAIAFWHLSSLRKMLKQISRDLSHARVELTSSASPRRSRQQERIYQTLQSLAMTILAFTLLGTFFCIISVLAAVSPLALATSPVRAQAILLGPLWGFAVFGLPCAVLLVLRANDASPSEERERESAYQQNSSSARKGSSGAAQRMKDASASAAAANEYSIQLANLPGLKPALTLSPSSADEEPKRGGLEWFGGWGNARRTSVDEQLSQSVSVHVDVDVKVETEKDDEGEEWEEKRGTSFLRP